MLNTDYLIRPCRFDDCTMILNLWHESEIVSSITDNIDEIKRLIDYNNDLFLVTEADNRVVGSVIGGWDGWRGSIYKVAVLPEYRRQGIGKSMVREVERRLEAKGAMRISVLVDYDDTQAMSFWHSLGVLGYERDPRLVRYVKTI
jgi:ribosomal protein S18 acetylase RimI-like enzyme